jgi:periplasmic copper chaperone A
MAATTAVVTRRLRRSALGGLAALAAGALLPAVASAHVEVKPGSVPGGDFAEVSFAVPNEESDASTVKLLVLLPTDTPLASVQTTPLPGWAITTRQRKLSEPIELEGAQISKVVSKITWKATDGGIAPGQFEDFPVSLGVLPESGKLVFKAVQTYSNGDVVTWNETAIGGAEPEHPAPTLELTAPDAGRGGGGTTTQTTAPPADDHAASSPDDDDSSSDTAPLVLATAALVVSLGALGLAWRRGRA